MVELDGLTLAVESGLQIKSTKGDIDFLFWLSPDLCLFLDAGEHATQRSQIVNRN